MFTHNLTEVDGHRSLTVFDTEDPSYSKVVDEGHASFQHILEALIEDPQDTQRLIDLIDPEIAIRKAVQDVSKRVTVDRNGVYVDGIKEQGDLSRLIHQKLYNGDTDWARFVRFMLNLSENPSNGAQRAVFAWVQQHGATITEDGRIVGFKGLQQGTDIEGNEVATSVHTGPNNFIDGVLYGEPDVKYHVPYVLGTTVSKRRRDVDDGPAACSTGLHVGAYDYALTFGENRSKSNGDSWSGSTFALVAFNPRDVVSDLDSNLSWKIRVCELEVIEFLDTSDNVLDGKTKYDTEDQTLDTEDEADLDAVAGEDGASGPAAEEPVNTRPLTLADYAANHPNLKADLENRNFGHKPLARKWSEITTEASVRRYRKANGIRVSLRAKVAG